MATRLSGLNVGSGPDIRPTWVNVDVLRLPGVDIVCDACYLPFKDRSFPFVYARDLLHHVRSPSGALAELGRVANDCVEVWESNRYNPYMLLFMVATGFEHRHFSRRRFHRLFRGSEVRFERRNNYDHFYSRPPYGPVVEILKKASLVLPAYNVAFFRPARESVSRASP